MLGKQKIEKDSIRKGSNISKCRASLSKNVRPNFELASDLENLGIYFPWNQSKSCHFVQPFSNLILTAIIRLSTCIHSVEILKKVPFKYYVKSTFDIKIAFFIILMSMNFNSVKFCTFWGSNYSKSWCYNTIGLYY